MKFYILITIGLLYDIILETKRNKYVSRGDDVNSKISNGFYIVQDLIKLRWVPEILESLHLGNQRYSEIQRSIPYISHTELNRKLAILVGKKVISKNVDRNSIDYSLLDFGEDLVHIFKHLEDMQEKYFKSS